MSLSGKILGAVAVFQDISRIKDAEQLKDDFLSLVSHELRTPLTTIRGGSALLLRDWQQLDAEVRGEILSDISSESQRLAMLIENMVQLTSIRAGRLGLQPEPVLLAGLVERIATAVQEMAAGQAVMVRLEPQLVAEADPALVEQTLRILLHNAVKHAPGSAIEITGCRRGDRIVLGVRDYGPGIDEAEIPHAFERFHRGSGNSVPGLGLGLYLARHLVEVSAGDIWIESPQDGGVRVLFTLPAVDLQPEE